MCGIFGWSLPKDANVTPEQRVILTRALAAMNDARGGDSWGLYVLNGSVSVMRGLGEAWDTAPFPEFHLDEAEVIFGHARRATTGGKTIPNSHPFEITSKLNPERKIIGAHNGIIYEHEKLNAKYDRKFEVDSMHIFGHIVEDFPTRELTGYGACEYVYPEKPGIVHLFRFNAGELSVMGLTDKDDAKGSKGVIWSSNTTHVETALKIAGIRNAFHFSSLETEKIYDVVDGKLFNTKDPIVFGSGYASTTYSSSRSDVPFAHGSRYGTTYERTYEDYDGEGGQTAVWGQKNSESEDSKDGSETGRFDFETWESENYRVTRRRNVTTLMKKNANEDTPTPSPSKLENEPTSPDEAKTASETIVAELSSAQA